VTPLMWAVERKNIEMSDLLIAAGADVNYQNDIGQTALFLAVHPEDMEDIVQAIVKSLVDAGADVNVSQDGMGWYDGMTYTPLMYAAEKKDEEVCKILIAAGADTGNISLKKSRKIEEREINELITRLEQEGNNVVETAATCRGGGIKCCPEYTTGDNDGKGGEHFVQEENYNIAKGCKGTCLDLYPDTRGITESLTQKYANKKQNKCWCEMGDPILKVHALYKTCIFK